MNLCPFPDVGRGWLAGIRRTTSLSIARPKACEICWAMRGQPQRGLRWFGLKNSSYQLL